ERQTIDRLWSDVDSLEKRTKESYSRTKQTGFLNRANRERTHRVKFAKDAEYRLEMESPDINCRLKVLTNLDEMIAETPADSTNRKAVLVFKPAADGVVQIVATTSKQTGAGAYTITIDEFRSVRP